VSIARVAVIGAGRVGLSLARALARARHAVTVVGRQATPLPEPLAPATTDWEAAIGTADLVLVTVPDDALTHVAARLARGGSVGGRHVLLHTSGLHDRSVFAVLESSGAGLGSWHPVQTFALSTGEPGVLAGSPAVVEGDARAVATGRELADLLHLRPVIEIAAEHKAAYHAGAVFASNYMIVLADIAAGLARDAGADAASARLFVPLMRSTLANYAAGGAATLTGPISRGDAGTLARHLEALQGAERALYIGLGREALRLAAASGLDTQKVKAVERLLY
jgi:predicted short-subunit dehydrogenase-like oxidoreductase (DUF2520 family)